MKLNDKETQSIAAAVSDVLEGKTVKKEEVKYPHKMYHPEDGKEVEVKDKAEHDKYAEKGYVHEKPKMESPEEPRAKGEKDFKDKHVVKKSGEKEDGTVVKEEEAEEAMSKKQYKAQKSKSQNKSFKNVRNRLENVEEATKEEGYMDVEEGEELSDKQKKYQAFFKKALKKFGVESPAELEDEKKKEFFNYVDKNYEADKEED